MVPLELVPTYEYECPRCPRVFEVRQRISEPPLSTCDRCGGPIRRLLAPAPFILKGGGWYMTDYPSESRKKAAEAEKSPASPAAEPKSSTTSADSSSTDSGKGSSPPAKSSSA
jgi:putative FmdB family regulatory protein